MPESHKKLKKYQYLYLIEKLESQYLEFKYDCEIHNCWNEMEVMTKRNHFYHDWLDKINKRYNYA